MEEKAYWETLPFWAHLKDAEQQYIKDNIHLSELQDIYNLRLR